MAYTSLTAGVVTRAGLTPNFINAPGTGAGNGVSFPNDGTRILRLRNTSGSAVVATVNFGRTIDGTPATGGKPVTIPATTGDVTAGPWPTADYNQSDGSVTVDFPTTTGVSVAVTTQGG